METAITTTSTSSPKSLLLSDDKLTQALQAQDSDFVSQVFLVHQKGMGIEKAASSNAPTFHDVTNFFSEQSTLFWLRFHIAETFAFLGIYDRASVYQIRQTAELIMQHPVFGQLTLDEFLCFLQRFKMGSYGKIYQSARPNPQEFLACLTPFWNELSQVRGRMEEKRRQEELSRSRHSPENITWEEYCKLKGVEKENPLQQL